MEKYITNPPSTKPAPLPPGTSKSKALTVMVDVRNIDCVKNVIRVINNCIYEECGVVSEYNEELLEALLGKEWHKEYCLGEQFIKEDRNESKSFR